MNTPQRGEEVFDFGTMVTRAGIVIGWKSQEKRSVFEPFIISHPIVLKPNLVGLEIVPVVGDGFAGRINQISESGESGETEEE